MSCNIFRFFLFYFLGDFLKFIFQLFYGLKKLKFQKLFSSVITFKRRILFSFHGYILFYLPRYHILCGGVRYLFCVSLVVMGSSNLHHHYK